MECNPSAAAGDREKGVGRGKTTPAAYLIVRSPPVAPG
jgi:hypothetical protein